MMDYLERREIANLLGGIRLSGLKASEIVEKCSFSAAEASMHSVTAAANSLSLSIAALFRKILSKANFSVIRRVPFAYAQGLRLSQGPGIQPCRPNHHSPLAIGGGNERCHMGIYHAWHLYRLLFLDGFKGLFHLQNLDRLPSGRPVPFIAFLMAASAASFSGWTFIGHPGAISAMHSTAAPYLNTGGSILLRDVYWRYIRKQKAGDQEQPWVNRIFATIITLPAFFVAMKSTAMLVILGAFATSFGALMYIVQLGVLRGWKLPRIGAILGLIVGMITVILTYHYSILFIHPAASGAGLGFLVAYLCRGLKMKDDEETVKRQKEVRTWLNSIDSPTESGRKWRSACKVLVPVWFFFGIGPGVLLSSTAYAFAGFNHIWSWQISWWIFAIFMMWALCFKHEFSTIIGDMINRAEIQKNLVIEQ